MKCTFALVGGDKLHWKYPIAEADLNSVEALSLGSQPVYKEEAEMEMASKQSNQLTFPTCILIRMKTTSRLNFLTNIDLKT